MAIKVYAQRKNLEIRPRARTLVLVADAGKAYFYRRDETHASPMLTAALEPIMPQSLARETGRRALPRVFQSAGMARHMAEPHVNIRQEARRRFVLQILKRLYSAQEEGLLDRLVIIAPPKMIGDLRERMSADFQKTIIAEITKDLTRAPTEALAQLLGERSLL